MLTDIKKIRLYKREIKVSAVGRYYYDTVLLDTTSYISAIFHAQLYDLGDFELVLAYDTIAKTGVLTPLINGSATIIVELCGQSTGDIVESRVFKTTEFTIENDDNNNKTIRLKGVGALGFYKNIPFGRILGNQSACTKTAITGGNAYFPTKLIIGGYAYNNDYVATPIEHLYRKMIFPFGVLYGARETIEGTELCCPDLGLWIKQDKSRGIGDLISNAEHSVALQADISKWLSEWMKSYGIGIIGSGYVRTGVGTPLDGHSVVGLGMLPQFTIAKLRNTGLTFRDSDGSFALNEVLIDRTYVGEGPLMQGQSMEEVGVDEQIQKYDGIKLCGCYAKENLNKYGFPFNGTLYVDGAEKYAPSDINYPVLVKSDFALDSVTDDTNRQLACDTLTGISKQQAPNYANTVSINGTINVANNPDIYLGDIVNISVLNGMIQRSAIITGFTYVSEGSGLKIEVDYQ